MEREFAFTDDNFHSIASLVHRNLGIQLSVEKMDLVYARLARRLRKLGLNAFDDYLHFLETDGGTEMENLANAGQPPFLSPGFNSVS